MAAENDSTLKVGHLDLSEADKKTLMECYDKDRSGDLSQEEINQLVRDYNDKKIVNKGVRGILAKYDTDHDGILSPYETRQFKHDVPLKIGPLDLSDADYMKLVDSYDMDDSGQLTQDDVDRIVIDYNNNRIKQEDVRKILARYDVNGDGILDPSEIEAFENHVDLVYSPLRIAGYSQAFAAAFRYLAFTSDFGEALRPIVAKGVVTSTYLIAGGYCVTDVAWEAYKLKQRGYRTIDQKPMSMSQLIVERSTFQAIASVAVPFALIHTTVNVSHRIFQKLGRFNRYGPSLCGLALIPLLPMYLDKPVEHGLEHVFAHYGPWAHKKKTD